MKPRKEQNSLSGEPVILIIKTLLRPANLRETCLSTPSPRHLRACTLHAVSAWNPDVPTCLCRTLPMYTTMYVRRRLIMSVYVSVRCVRRLYPCCLFPCHLCRRRRLGNSCTLAKILPRALLLLLLRLPIRRLPPFPGSLPPDGRTACGRKRRTDKPRGDRARSESGEGREQERLGYDTRKKRVLSYRVVVYPDNYLYRQINT